MIGIIPAAGIGTRMGRDIPKQYLRIHERTILDHSVAALLADPRISSVIVALHPEDTLFALTQAARDTRVSWVLGGSSRARSVLNALQFAARHASEDVLVVVHDAARPGLPARDLARLLDQAEREPEHGCILAIPVADTLKSATDKNEVSATVDREMIWQAQTPQVFQLAKLLSALERAEKIGLPVTDESSAMEAIGGVPRLVQGSRACLKVTEEDDLPLVSFYLNQQVR